MYKQIVIVIILKNLFFYKTLPSCCMAVPLINQICKCCPFSIQLK